MDRFILKQKPDSLSKVELLETRKKHQRSDRVLVRQTITASIKEDNDIQKVPKMLDVHYQTVLFVEQI